MGFREAPYDIVAYRYLLSAAPPGWTPPGSPAPYTPSRDDLAAMQPQPIAPEAPAFAENTEAGLRMFKIGGRPHVAERHDGYDLLLDMETRAVGVQWPAAPSSAKVEEMCARLAAAEVYVRKYMDVLDRQDGSLFADAAAMIRVLASMKEKTDG